MMAWILAGALIAFGSLVGVSWGKRWALRRRAHKIAYAPRYEWRAPPPPNCACIMVGREVGKTYRMLRELVDASPTEIKILHLDTE